MDTDIPMRPNAVTVSPYPAPFDFDSDSLKPGNADMFHRQLVDALQTRGWWEALTTDIPSIELARLHNPGIDDAVLFDAI